MTRADLSLGSNLTNDRGALLRAALRALTERGVRVVRRSPVLETAPIGGPPGQGAYLNQVVTVLTDLSAHALLTTCQEIEAALGRRRTQRWGPRTIDIDILTFGRDRIASSDLVVPHPALITRAFVPRLRRMSAVAPPQ